MDLIEGNLPFSNQEYQKKARAPAKSENSGRGTRLSEDWELPAEWLQYGVDGGLTKAEVELIASEMLTWSLTKKAGTSRDWKRTWQTWCRRHKSWIGRPLIIKEVTLPQCDKSRAMAEELMKRVGRPAFISWFQPAPMKNADRWEIQASPVKRDMIEVRFGAILNDLFGKGRWGFVSPSEQ